MFLKVIPKFNSSIFFNFFLCLIPFSMILGNTAININTLLICFIGLFIIFKNNLKFEFNLVTKIICLFLISATIASILSIGFDLALYNKSNSYFENFIKSLLFFRWILFLVVIQTLNKYNLVNFDYLLYSFSFLA